MTVVLALDIGTHTGCAHDAPGGRKPLCATWEAPYAEPKDFGTRYLAFMRWLDEVFVVVKPELFVFEAPLGSARESYRANPDTVRLLIGLASHAEMVSTMHAVQPFEVNIGTIKKHFAGHGRASKPDMKARCRQLGWEIKNDHEADAAGLWAYAKALDDPAWSFGTTSIGHYIGERQR